MRYLIDGCYGDTNIGDECLLDSTIRVIRKNDSVASICVLSDDPKETSDKFKVSSIQQCNPFGTSIYGAVIKSKLWPIIQSIRNCDTFILGGGELFRDDKGLRATLGMFYRMEIAKYLGKKLLAFGIGMQEPQHWWGKLILNSALKSHNHIIFRSIVAQRIANSQVKQLKNNSFAPDPVFSLDWPELKTVHNDTTRKIHLGIAVKALNQSHANYDAACKRLLHVLNLVCQSLASSRTIEFKLLPFSSTDVQLSKQLANLLGDLDVKIIEPIADDLKRSISKLDIMIAVPLHASVFSFAIGVPTVGISYDSKVHRLYDSFNCTEHCLSVNDLSKSKLIFTIKKMLLNRPTISNHLLQTSKSSKHEFEREALRVLSSQSEI
ncbi:MAG: hypothetical protein COA78_06120 [Blastopirellula sp.]|nr:MAG: hypothetical protein COA78_06120 [Blastopirellula sp.]